MLLINGSLLYKLSLFCFSILENPNEFYREIGYCPQFDALFDELTPVEQLHLYARLRGVLPRDEVKVKHLLQDPYFMLFMNVLGCRVDKHYTCSTIQ